MNDGMSDGMNIVGPDQTLRGCSKGRPEASALPTAYAVTFGTEDLPE
jgi:hypothetical protein